MNRNNRAYLFIALLCFFLLTKAPLFSYPPPQGILLGEFWYELTPLIILEDEYPVKESQAVKYILELAQYVFSAMIYGMSFQYTPSDNARGVKELFEIELNAKIPWGDPNLAVINTRVEDEKLFARIRYDLESFQEKRREGWQSNVIPSISGNGRSNLIKDRLDKKPAIEEAIKFGIRQYLRTKIYNKPKEVRGSLLLEEVPNISMVEVDYLAQVRFRLHIEEIVPYITLNSTEKDAPKAIPLIISGIE